MQGSNLDNMPINNNDPKVIQTDSDRQNGQTKCPKCGATDISLNSRGKLQCHFCRHEFEPVKVTGFVSDISQLQGQVMGSGAQNIVDGNHDVVTFKCSSCGAEVVIDTVSAMQARCHWCRNMLSINQQIPNGSVPDMVLPFYIPKEVAKVAIEKFVGKRKFFAHPQFRKQFTTENIMGVYFPYMVVDANCHANLSGYGEHQTRRYTVGNENNRKTYYDADLYEVRRDFDLIINGLTVESNKERLDKNTKDKTNNIINAIMPFDTENCVRYDANYLRGYTSEKRDINVENLQNVVETQAKDIARLACNDTLKYYDRGVAWSQEQLEFKGQQWKAAYLPVWLYSYQEIKGNRQVLHYVAVNARTKETMGSVPIHMPKLFLISFVVEMFGVLAMLFINYKYDWLFLLIGVIYFLIMYGRYRNAKARHHYEFETKKQITNLKKGDRFIENRKRLISPKISGANNMTVSGKMMGSQLLDSVSKVNSIVSFTKDIKH